MTATGRALTADEADELMLAGEYGDLVEGCEDHPRGWVYALVDGRAVLVTRDGRAREVGPDEVWDEGGTVTSCQQGFPHLWTVNDLLERLVDELADGEVTAALGERFTLGALWADLARLAGEELPLEVRLLVGDGPAGDRAA